MGTAIRTACLLTAVALTAAACGDDGGSEDAASGSGSEEVRDLTIGRIASSPYTPVDYGVASGFFEERGINVEVVDIPSAGPQVTAVESGSIDMFLNTPVVAASANQAGSELRLFCGSSTQTVSFLMAEGAGEPATEDTWEETVRSWEGQVIGVPALGGNAEFIVRDLAEQAGLAPDDLELVAVGPPTGAAIQQLQSGDIGVLYSFPYFTESLRDSTTVALNLATVGPESLVNQIGSTWVASQEWLDDNAELATEFCGYYGELISEVQDPANAEAVNAVLEDVNGIPADTVDDVREAALEEGGGLRILTTDITCEQIHDAVILTVESGQLPEEPACDTLLWSEA